MGRNEEAEAVARKCARGMTPEEREASIYTHRDRTGAGGACIHGFGGYDGQCHECTVKAIEDAIAEEREACAVICELLAMEDAAKAIRGRSSVTQYVDYEYKPL